MLIVGLLCVLFVKAELHLQSAQTAIVDYKSTAACESKFGAHSSSLWTVGRTGLQGLPSAASLLSVFWPPPLSPKLWTCLR